jgi:hypothetical protein
MRDRWAIAFVALALGAGGSGCQTFLGPSQPDGNWHLYDRGHFTFYARPGSFCEQNIESIAQVLEDQFASSVSALKLTYGGHIAAFLHSSGADAGFGSDAGGGNHSGVAYPQTETVRAACVAPLEANLYSLLSHEANHVIIINGLGRPGTRFVNEGLASAIVSEHFHKNGPTFYYAWTAAHRAQIPHIADMADDAKWASYPQEMVYNAGASFLAYLLSAYDEPPFRKLFYADSSSFASAFQSAYGRALSDAEADWLAFCQAQG